MLINANVRMRVNEIKAIDRIPVNFANFPITNPPISIPNERKIKHNRYL